VFVDAVSSVGTMAWAAETRHAIRTCGAVLMVLSPADGRRVGIRHEGVLARRRHKPVFVLRRTPGDLPRYLQKAVVLDVSDDQYDSGLAQLFGVLPPAAQFFQASDPPSARRPRRPPRHPDLARRRRRVVMIAALLFLLTVCLAVGIAFGVIPV
jgi:hypothetical protein